VWDELYVLARQIRTLMDEGAFTDCPPLSVDATTQLGAELFARVTLADIDHVRWEQRHGFKEFAGDDRLQGLIDDSKRLLVHCENHRLAALKWAVINDRVLLRLR
jgi:hypothetical protein